MADKKIVEELDNESYNYLMSKTAKILPTNPTSQGWTAERIRRTYYEGFTVIFEWLKNFQKAVNSAYSSEGIYHVEMADKDGEGNVITETYLAKADAQEIIPNPSGTATTKLKTVSIDGVIYKLNSGSYTNIAINSLSGGGTYEIGSSVDSVTLKWTYSAEPVEQYINNEKLDINLRTITLSGPFTSNKTFILKVIGEEEEVVIKSVSINFVYPVYYGVSTSRLIYFNDFILNLDNKRLSNSKMCAFTVTTSEGEYIYFAQPTSYGTPTFSVGGFEGGFELARTIQFTNSSGYTTTYSIYKSVQSELGSTTVEVT